MSSNNYGKQYINGFHYFMEVRYMNRPFSEQRDAWMALSEEKKQELDGIAFRSQYQQSGNNVDMEETNEAKGITKKYDTGYNVFCAELTKKTSYITKEQWDGLRDEQRQTLQGLIGQELENVGLEELNTMIGTCLSSRWSERQKKMFREMVPSMTASNMAQKNKEAGELWKSLPVEKKNHYARIAYLSKIKFVDQLKKRKPPKKHREALSDLSDKMTQLEV
jgi:hypothetical protein